MSKVLNCINESDIFITRKDYNRKPSIILYTRNIDKEEFNKIVIPKYENSTFERKRTIQNIFFFIIFLLFLSSFYFLSITSFLVPALMVFPAIIAIIYNYTTKVLDKKYYNKRIGVYVYLTEKFTRFDYSLVKKHCEENFLLWSDAVVDAELYGCEEAEKYVRKIINIAQLRKANKEKTEKEILANRWVEHNQYAENQYIAEKEIY